MVQLIYGWLRKHGDVILFLVLFFALPFNIAHKAGRNAIDEHTLSHWRVAEAASATISITSLPSCWHPGTWWFHVGDEETNDVGNEREMAAF